MVPQLFVAAIITVVIPLLKIAPLPVPAPVPMVAPEKVYEITGIGEPMAIAE